MKTFAEIYQDHAEMPYIAPQYEENMRLKPVPKRNMIRTEENLLPGHIILLWRIQFGSYRTNDQPHKYFATTYGIDAKKEVLSLMEQGYVRLESATEAIRHLTALQVKNLLKTKDVKGLSKMKRADLDQAMVISFTEQELAELIDTKAYLLTEKGQEILGQHPDIIDKHPQKKF